MGKGGSKKVDTADAIEARRIAIEEFNDRMRFGAPAEQFYMQQVDRMRTPGQYQRAAGLASAAMQPELEAARTQLDAQNGCLNTVQTRITSDHIVIITLALTMVGDHSQFACQLVIIGEDGPAISIASQILRGEEGSTADVSDSSGLG